MKPSQGKLDSRNALGKDYFALAFVFTLAFFQRLGEFPLIGTDEARYMEIPREMIERGDFVTPTLNYVPYFEKPPLHYWLNAASISIFGETPLAARFFGALWGVLGTLLVYHLGRKIFGREEGLISALVFGTSIGVVAQGRVNITDTTLSFFLCASLGSFVLGVMSAGRQRPLFFHLVYVFAAFAVLSKGLIGIVLPAAVIISFIVATRKFFLLKDIVSVTGAVLFALLAAPWFVMVSNENPEFANFFFIHEHFERYLTKSHNRYQPPWFYLPVLFGCMLPWSFFLPTGVSQWWAQRKKQNGDLVLFLVLWVGVILIFFSFSSSKLIPYILPVYPALAILLGPVLVSVLRHDLRVKTEGLALAAFSFLAGLGITLYPQIAREPRITASGALVVGCLFAAQGIVAILGVNSQKQKAMIFGLVVTSYILGIFAPPVVLEGIARRKVTRNLALMVKRSAGKDDIVASFGYQQELPLYTKRRVIVVGNQGELEFGSKQGDNRYWFMDFERFRTVWAGSKPVYALVSKEELGPLKKTLKPVPALLGIEGRQALITNKKGNT